MTRLNQLEEGLRQIEAGRFQKLANEYLCREYGLKHLSAFGSQVGTDKTTVGIPDSFSREDDGYVLIAHTTSTSDTFKKIKGDIGDCLVKSGVPNIEIRKIICCHTNFRLSPDEYRKLEDIDNRVKVISPSQMARDIVYKYPVLAHEYFGIALGSGAFKTRDEYLSAQDLAQYSTSQSHDIMFRENEISNLKKRLEDGAKAVIVTGTSGCGKTKLALEACTNFCKENNKDLLILEARNASHADADISVIVAEAEDTIILVDDANQQTALDHLLDVVASRDSITLVATVRSYAVQDLKRRIETYIEPHIQEVPTLNDEQIGSIIKKQYHVYNHFAAERIASIAHGNLRLAIMAASALEDGRTEFLECPYDMLSAYIEPRLEHYSPDMVKTLEAFAIWGVCDIHSDDDACKYLNSVGIDISEIRRFAHELNDDEIIDLLSSSTGDLAVRFQEQNLKDFLVHKAFVTDKTLDLSAFVVKHILNDRSRVVGVCRIIIDVFGDQIAADAVRAAAQSALVQAKNDSALELALMSDFHAFYGALALEYARCLISEKPDREICEDFFSKNSSADTSVALRILAWALRRPEYTEIAAQIIANCVAKGCEKDDEYRWFFSKNNALALASLEKEFKEEKLLLEALGTTYIATRNGNVASCLLLFAETLLHGSGENAVWRESGSMQISYFHFPYCSQRAQLDYKCLKTLHLVLGDERFESRIRSLFCSHFGWHGDLDPDSDFSKMLSEEVVLLQNTLADYFAKNGLDEYSCFLRLNELLKLASAEPMQASLIFDRGVVDAWMLKQNENSVSEIIQEWQLERVVSACEAVAGIPQSSYLCWDYRELVPKVIEHLVDGGYSCEQCLDLLFRYLEKSGRNKSFRYLPAGVFDPLVACYGYQSIRNELEHTDLGCVKTIALDALDFAGICIRPEEASQNKLLAMLADGELHLDYSTASRVGDSEGAFLYTYTTESLKNISDRPHLISYYIHPVSEGSRGLLAQSIAATFCGRLEEFASWYTVFQQENHFDYDGSIACLLFERCDNFASDYISGSTSTYLSQWGSTSDRIKRMWCAEYAAMPTIITQLVEEFYSREDLFGNPITTFLPVRNLKVGTLQACWDWLFSYIDEKVGDIRRMQDIVQAFGDAGEPERLVVLTHVLTADATGNLVGSLWIGRTSMSGDARQGFSQAYKREAAFFQRLSDALPKTTAYLRHKAWLERCAAHSEVRAEDELWRAFHKM